MTPKPRCEIVMLPDNGISIVAVAGYAIQRSATMRGAFPERPGWNDSRMK
jgi:hypothetical protein